MAGQGREGRRFYSLRNSYPHPTSTPSKRRESLTMEEDEEENKVIQKLKGPKPNSSSSSSSLSTLEVDITANLLRDLALHHEETEEDKEFTRSLEDSSLEVGVSLPPTVSSKVLLLFQKISGAPEFRLAKWLASARKRSRVFGPSGFPTRTLKATNMFSDFSNNVKSEETEPESSGLHSQSSDSALETTLWERLGKAVALDIECSDFSWDKLVSLHHTEHTSSTELSEEEMNKPVEVTVNSGGVVFFALFEINQGRDAYSKEGVAVIKFSSSRLATQSERLGYEFAKRFGIQTPQARVIHNSTDEWQRIKDAAEQSKSIAFREGDKIGKATSTELLEALELSRCLLLMGYVHGCPLLETPHAFNTEEGAQKTATALGRVLLLDLVLRNEDRLPCRQLGWRGNSANLLFTEKLSFINVETSLQGNPESMPRRNRETAVSKERRFYSVDGRCGPDKTMLLSQSSDTCDWFGYVRDIHAIVECVEVKNCISDFYVVAIDSGVPRRPPAGKRSADQLQYPKLVELLLNSNGFCSNLLYEISGAKLGCRAPDEATGNTDFVSLENVDHAKVVHEFRSGFRAASREMQNLHVFLLKLNQKLEALLRTLMPMVSKSSPSDEEKEDSGNAELYSASPVSCNYQSPILDKEVATAETIGETEDFGWNGSAGFHDLSGKQFSKSPSKDSWPETASPSPVSRDNWHGKHFRGNGDGVRSMRLSSKLKDINKNAKVDSDLNKELEAWNESLRTDVIKFCQENGFNTGFFEGSDSNYVVDNYELKVRLEHLLERMSLISQAADTERPSCVTNSLFIGGALAAKSINTLQHFGITHILCLCSHELGQSEAQYPQLFEYRNFPIYDTDDANISQLFEEASDFIKAVERKERKILVHCFEGKSRSATVVLAFLMLHKSLTLSEAWNQLKKVHRRAQPNDGFMKALLELDKRLHGKASMDWQQRKPVMRTCPICGKSAGLSSSSLKLHLQKAHRRISSGSVDSIDLKDLQQALESAKTC